MINEQRLRRTAARHGYRVVKSRRHVDRLQPFRLFERSTNALVSADGIDLEGVEARLRELGAWD